MENLIEYIAIQLNIILSDIDNAKFLVNGKPIDADRKLQSIQTKLINLIKELKEKS